MLIGFEKLNGRLRRKINTIRAVYLVVVFYGYVYTLSGVLKHAILRVQSTRN